MISNALLAYRHVLRVLITWRFLLKVLIMLCGTEDIWILHGLIGIVLKENLPALLAQFHLVLTRLMYSLKIKIISSNINLGMEQIGSPNTQFKAIGLTHPAQVFRNQVFWNFSFKIPHTIPFISNLMANNGMKFEKIFIKLQVLTVFVHGNQITIIYFLEVMSYLV